MAGHSCRMHCPRGHGRLPWRLDLLLTLLVVGGGAWLVGRVASVVGLAVSSAMAVALWVLAVTAVGVVARSVVVAVLNRRARARFAVLEREAWASREQQPAALTGGARELEAAPVVRAEAFRVEQLRDVA